MIRIENKNYTISDLKGLSVSQKNFLYENLDKGNCVIKLPEFNSQFSKTELDYVRKAYKVGFLFDLLTEIYPNYNNMHKYKIIDEQYHLFLSHKRLLDIYKKDYVGKFSKF